MLLISWLLPPAPCFRCPLPNALRWAILENVDNLKTPPRRRVPGGVKYTIVGPSNLDVVAYRLSNEAGFASVTLQLDPRNFGFPCSRTRLYILCRPLKTQGRIPNPESSVLSPESWGSLQPADCRQQTSDVRLLSSVI